MKRLVAFFAVLTVILFFISLVPPPGTPSEEAQKIEIITETVSVTNVTTYSVTNVTEHVSEDPEDLSVTTSNVITLRLTYAWAGSLGAKPFPDAIPTESNSGVKNEGEVGIEIPKTSPANSESQ